MNKIIKTTAEVFADKRNLTAEDVVYKLQHRQLVGEEIDGQWYVFSEAEPQYRDVEKLSFPLRMLNAFFIAFMGASLLSVYSISTTSSFEGEAGLAGVFTFFFAFPVIGIAMLFIKKAEIHKHIAIVSLMIGLLVLIVFNS